MLTIKHVTSASENLWEATSPRLVYPEKQGDLATVYFEMGDGATCSIDSGIIYVMNANGKTVETWRMKGSEAL